MGCCESTEAPPPQQQQYAVAQPVAANPGAAPVYVTVLVSSTWDAPNFRIRMRVNEMTTVEHITRKVNEVLSNADNWDGSGEFCVGLSSEWLVRNDPGAVFNPGDMMFQLDGFNPYQPRPRDAVFLAYTAGAGGDYWTSGSFWDSDWDDTWVFIDLGDQEWYSAYGAVVAQPLYVPPPPPPVFVPPPPPPPPGPVKVNVFVSGDFDSPNFLISMMVGEGTTVHHVKRKVNEVLAASDAWTGDSEVAVGLSSEWLLDEGLMYAGQDRMFQLPYADRNNAWDPFGGATANFIAITAGCDHGYWRGQDWSSFDGWVVIDMGDECWW